jgi:hypothetical protein
MNRLVLSIFFVCVSAFSASAVPVTTNGVKKMPEGQLTCLEDSFLHQITNDIIVCIPGVPNQGIQRGHFSFGKISSGGKPPEFNPKLNLDNETLYECTSSTYLNTDLTKNQAICYKPKRAE